MRCERCSQTPGFHSFDHLRDISGLSYYYCFPAHNKDSVKTREDMWNFASHFPETGRWSLLFHANRYGLSSMMPLHIAIELGRLVQETQMDRLEKIYIIQGSWFFSFVMRCVMPFLRPEMREKFVLLSGSLLEVCQVFLRQGLKLSDLLVLRARFGKS